MLKKRVGWQTEQFQSNPFTFSAATASSLPGYLYRTHFTLSVWKKHLDRREGGGKRVTSTITAVPVLCTNPTSTVVCSQLHEGVSCCYCHSPTLFCLADRKIGLKMKWLSRRYIDTLVYSLCPPACHSK